MNASLPARSRWLYLALCALTIAAGLSTRLFRGTGAAEWAANAGDALWAVLVYLGLAVLFPAARSWVLLVAASLIATGVEVSQLYHAPWIDAVRRTTLGGLVLGWGFAWSDLLCYYAGAGACLLGEQFFAGCSNLPHRYSRWQTGNGSASLTTRGPARRGQLPRPVDR